MHGKDSRVGPRSRDLERKPDVREGQADRRTGTGIYAFVEGGPGLSERGLRDFIATEPGPQPPEHLQVVEALPRGAAGEVRSEILQLVAMNQIDQIEDLVADNSERALIASIVAERRNLRDRVAF